MVRALGVDGDKRGWVGIVLVDGRFAGAHLTRSLDELADEVDGLAAIAVDMPIGWCEGIRTADALVRRALPGKASSVFSSPPAVVRDASTHADANEASRAATGKGLSAQSFALVPKIVEATAFARASSVPVVEAHPELCFATMADGGPIRASKLSWHGHRERVRRLAEVGIVVPDDLGAAGAAGMPDVLDAAAVAWTAARFASGSAVSLPDPPEPDVDGHPTAVWV